MTWTLCTSGAAIDKAGTHANSTIIDYGTAASKVTLDKWSDEFEGAIELQSGKAFITDIGNAPGGIANGISNVVSSWIAMQIASYDPTGYSSREFNSLMNFHNDIVQKGIAELKRWSSTTLNNPFTTGSP